MTNESCNLCGGKCEHHGFYRVLDKYSAEFWHCSKCGYSYLAEPSWLQESYSSAITSVDIGPLDRCIENSRAVKMLIELCHSGSVVGLDYGGGYGLLTRRMRDLGYNFLWNDLHCANIFAKGFEGTLSGAEKYDVITAFEVLEHLFQPRKQLDLIISSCDLFIFSTLLIPNPIPRFDQWWYYAPEHGQHISFYSASSLETLANKHGKHFVTNGSEMHMISSKRVNSSLFRWLTNRKVAAALGFFRPKTSLLFKDFEAGRKHALANLHSDSKGLAK